MKKCKLCEGVLSGRQTAFCSTKCKQTFHNKMIRTPKHIEETRRKNKIWRDKNKEKIAENKAKYYQKHKEKLKAIRRKYHKEFPEIDAKYKKSPKGRLMIYKRGARKRGFEFELTLDYFEENWNKKCVYCGGIIDGIGFDRKDSSIGYIESNIVNCCEMCNKMKLNHTKADFIAQCKKIALCQ